jgi:hypothetical protein
MIKKMESSKIHLSQSELNLVQNADIILTKNTIIKKTIALLESLQEAMIEESKSHSTDVFTISPKISKGENYLGLPYVVLDYPRISREDDLCFIRTLFWWGHFFSSTLQLSGTHKEQGLCNVISSYELLSATGYFIGINSNPWQHHFEETNYIKISTLTKQQFENILKEQPHIKIAAKWPLEEWDIAATSLYKSWNLLTGLIT